jgi:AcrR family transcriptional regulator
VVRTLDPTARAVRRDAILDVAERLFRARGYEQVSIQDVQDELGVSRGAIYHYFGSKAAMLEAVVERIADGVVAVIGPIAEDPDLPALEKLRGVFAAAGRWKAERRELMLAVLRAWYSHDNALVRERLRAVSSARMAPVLAGIVRQGRAEGVFTASSPEHAAHILVAMLEGSSDALGRLFLDRLAGEVSFAEVERAMAAYDEAVERILGLPAGSFELVDPPSLRFWFA